MSERKDSQTCGNCHPGRAGQGISIQPFFTCCYCRAEQVNARFLARPSLWLDIRVDMTAEFTLYYSVPSILHCTRRNQNTCNAMYPMQ